MPIQAGKLMEAKDVRDNIRNVIKDIYSKFDSFRGPVNNTGVNNNFWGYGTLHRDVIRLVGNVNQTNDFIQRIEDLKEHVKNLSVSYKVEPGEIIYLSGFYDYALSCYCEASYIRHSLYKLLDSQKNWQKYDTVSFLEEVPVLSSNVTGVLTNDFHSNWAENDQQDLSSISNYLNKWGNVNIAGYQYVNLNAFATYPDFDSSGNKPIKIGAVCLANPAKNLLGILSAINIMLGETISCLYYWWNGHSGPPTRLRIRYYTSSTAANPTRTDYCDIYDDYKITYSPSGISNFKWWQRKGQSNSKYLVGNTYKITENLDFIPFTGFEDMNVIIQCKCLDTTRPGGNNDYGTYGSIVSGYSIVNKGSLGTIGADLVVENLTGGGQLVKFTGLEGYSKITFDKVVCYLNEVSGSHMCNYYLRDMSKTGSSSFRTLIKYDPRETLSVYQYGRLIPDVPSLTNPDDPINNVVYSEFPLATRYATNIDGIAFNGKNKIGDYTLPSVKLSASNISLNINSSGVAAFEISCKYWRVESWPLGNWGYREFFLAPVGNYSDRGGIQGVKIE